MFQPAGMKALLLENLGPNFSGCRLIERDVPEPGPDEVLIRVEAAAINFVDLLMTTGGYQTKPPLPFVLGSDVAGRIEAVGRRVTGLPVGQEVMGMRLGGAFAQFSVIPASALKPKPERFTYAQSAAFGAAYYTSYVALTRRSHIRAGQWLLVHGASGGIGLAAVDIGRALGLKVIAASASREKLEILEREYRPEAVLHASGDFAQEVLKITAGAGADVIFDPVGGDVFERSRRCIAFNGEYLVLGFTSGRIPEVALNIALLKGFSIVGVRAGEYGRRFPDHAAADRAALWKLANDGILHPRVHAEFALEEWRRAFDLVATRQVVGRLVLCPQQE
jgi:NADPH2:quinone reductase